MPDTPMVVAVLPAYNATKTLERTCRDLPAGVVETVMQVDDVSQDDTVEIERKLGLPVIIHMQNRGYAAIKRRVTLKRSTRAPIRSPPEGVAITKLKG
jgi:glycosyltransferase involved in cell wall biosynthesis